MSKVSKAKRSIKILKLPDKKMKVTQASSHTQTVWNKGGWNGEI